jgi:hypothetical protein
MRLVSIICYTLALRCARVRGMLLFAAEEPNESRWCQARLVLDLHQRLVLGYVVMRTENQYRYTPPIPVPVPCA